MDTLHQDLKNALEVLKAGGVILYPTDTVWGIGCDATNELAVERVRAIKNKAAGTPMLVLLDKAPKLNTYVKEVPEMAWDLIEMSEKPVTIIYPQAENLAKSLLTKENTIGIRITNETFSSKLIERFRIPIVSTSANMSGKAFPKNFQEIDEKIKSSVDYVVEYRQQEKTPCSPSSIIQLGVDNQIKIIRP